MLSQAFDALCMWRNATRPDASRGLAGQGNKQTNKQDGNANDNDNETGLPRSVRRVCMWTLLLLLWPGWLERALASTRPDWGPSVFTSLFWPCGIQNSALSSITGTPASLQLFLSRVESRQAARGDQVDSLRRPFPPRNPTALPELALPSQVQDPVAHPSTTAGRHSYPTRAPTSTLHIPTTCLRSRDHRERLVRARPAMGRLSR